MKGTYYAAFTVFFACATFAHASSSPQIESWAKLFEVLAGLTIMFYLAKFKFEPTRFGQALMQASLLVFLLSPVILVSVSFMSKGWGEFFASTLSPESALIETTTTGANSFGGAKDAIVSLGRFIFHHDKLALLNARNVIHWWIAGLSLIIVYLKVGFKGLRS